MHQTANLDPCFFVTIDRFYFVIVIELLLLETKFNCFHLI
jgi:hypothetical protein